MFSCGRKIVPTQSKYKSFPRPRTDWGQKLSYWRVDLYNVIKLYVYDSKTYMHGHVRRYNIVETILMYGIGRINLKNM